MKQSIVRALFALTAVAGFASPSFATSILLESCNTVGLCNQVLVTTTLNAGVIDVLVTDQSGAPTAGLFGSTGNNHAFAFNVADPDAGVVVNVLTPGFIYAGANLPQSGPYGDFDFAIDGPQQGGDSTLPLHFTLTRLVLPFTNANPFELNDAGFLLTAHVAINPGTENAVTGWAAAGPQRDDRSVDPPPPTVPEPGSMVLLGTGLLGLAAGARRRMKK